MFYYILRDKGDGRGGALKEGGKDELDRDGSNLGPGHVMTPPVWAGKLSREAWQVSE